MVPAAHRLAGDKNFKRLVRSGSRFFSADLGIRILPNKQEKSRFAFVVSVKVSKKAVIRNTLKRRLREIVRHELEAIKSGYDVMIFTQKKAADLDYWQLQEQLNALFKKARLL